jgi:hypothetical protein
MALGFDFVDFYILYPGHPRFIDNTMIEDDLVRVIIQKYEMILFTNKGEVLGDPNFGGDLPRLLYQTRVSASTVEKNILEQIFDYIPEIGSLNFQLKVDFYADPVNYQDIMEIKFQITDYEVYAIIQ